MNIIFKDSDKFRARKWGVPNIETLTWHRVKGKERKRLYPAFGPKYRNAVFLSNRLEAGTIYVVAKQIDVGELEALDLIFLN